MGALSIDHIVRAYTCYRMYCLMPDTQPPIPLPDGNQGIKIEPSFSARYGV